MKLYTEEHGDGPPLLLLTGLGYAIWSWQRQLPDWSQRFRCVAVENRGTGRSPKPPGPYSIEEMADDAAEALDGRRAHVAGFSMGGYLAQTLAVRHPELVDRLVLICTGTGGPEFVPTPPETAAAWSANAGRPPHGVRPRDDAAVLPPRLDGRAPRRVRGAARRPARVPDAARVLARPVRRVHRLGRAA